MTREASKPHSRFIKGEWERVYDATWGDEYARHAEVGHAGYLSPDNCETCAALVAIEEQLEALQRIENAARDFLTACDQYGCSDAPLDQYATLVEAVSRLPDSREVLP
jgi:hypothetical protein